MKRKTLFLIAGIAAIACASVALAACKKPEPEHEHEYTVQNTESKYLKLKASHTEAAVYYYSCACGEKGEATFEYGAPMADHVYKDGVCVARGCNDLQTKGLKYELSSDETYYSVSGMGTCTDTEIYISARYEGKPVTRIGFYAFQNCASLTSVSI